MSTGRVIALIASSFAKLVAVAVIGAGGVLLWLHETRRGGDGY